MIHQTEHPYIVTEDGILSGEPIIRATRTPVRAVVELWRMGVTPELIPNRLPHLTPAQVFDALSYFSDHQAEINQYIERNRIPDELIDPLVRDRKYQQTANRWNMLRGLQSVRAVRRQFTAAARYYHNLPSS